MHLFIIIICGCIARPRKFIVNTCKTKFLLILSIFFFHNNIIDGWMILYKCINTLLVEKKLSVLALVSIVSFICLCYYSNNNNNDAAKIERKRWGRVTTRGLWFIIQIFDVFCHFWVSLTEFCTCIIHDKRFKTTGIWKKTKRPWNSSSNHRHGNANNIFH